MIHVAPCSCELHVEIRRLEAELDAQFKADIEEALKWKARAKKAEYLRDPRRAHVRLDHPPRGPPLRRHRDRETVPMMRVLDLFSGEGGFSKPFRDRGIEVVTLDFDARFQPDIKANLLRLTADNPRLQGFDIILASPPCTHFSLAAVYRHWPGGKPTEETQGQIRLALHAKALIDALAPRYWVIENPVGMMKHILGLPAEIIYLCAFGAPYKKPTYLWGSYNGPIRRPCAPHESAVRGSSKGVQGIGGGHSWRTAALRSMMPYGLGEELARRMIG